MSDGPLKESSIAALQAIKAKKGAIFDLDGVIVDTAKYHYLAWKRLASELGFEFTEAHNEALKGVSRMKSLEILLGVGGIKADEQTRRELAEKKNNWYVELISRMEANEVLPVREAFWHWFEDLGSRRLWEVQAGMHRLFWTALSFQAFLMQSLTVIRFPGQSPILRCFSSVLRGLI
jgi:beta-phosphoglucomutase-like phosphatase (HAD superfamily)